MTHPTEPAVAARPAALPPVARVAIWLVVLGAATFLGVLGVIGVLVKAS